MKQNNAYAKLKMGDGRVQKWKKKGTICIPRQNGHKNHLAQHAIYKEGH